MCFGNKRRAGGKLCSGQAHGRAEGGQELLLNDVILIYVRISYIVHLCYVAVRVTGLATQLIVTRKRTVTRENFHATKH